MNRRVTMALLGSAAIVSGIAFAQLGFPDKSAQSIHIVRERGQPKAALAATPAPVATSGAATLALAPPVLALVDPTTVDRFHDSNDNLCGTQKVHIDGPVRAFNHDGMVHMTVSDPNAIGWQWTGTPEAFKSTPDTAVLDCTPVLNGNNVILPDNDPDLHDQKTWIQAFFYRAGTAYAYGHQDYFGTRNNIEGCHEAGETDDLPYCWMASIPVWTAPASPTHLSFARSATPPSHVAIFPHVRYPQTATEIENMPHAGWMGYGTPSNIVRGRNADGSLQNVWYMFAYASATYQGQAKGVCLFRSEDPTDRNSWYAWDGNLTAPAFTQQMQDPTSHTNSACAVVKPTMFNTYVRSVVWHAPSRHYIAIFRNSSAVRYATSTDMVNWSAGADLLASTVGQVNYPVVIDFDSGGTDEETFDRLYGNGSAFLLYRESVVSGYTRINRRKLVVTNYDPDVPGS